MSLGHIPSDRMLQVSMNQPLSQLEIDGVAGRVPMDYRVGPPAKFNALLFDGRRGQHQRPEEAVKGSADVRRTAAVTVVSLRVAVLGSEADTHLEVLVRIARVLGEHLRRFKESMILSARKLPCGGSFRRWT